MQQFGEREAVLALAIALPLGALVLGFCKGRRSRSRGRSMSFGSGYMSIGSWPEDIKMNDPIITAFMFLDEVPKLADLEEVCSKVLRHENFKALPVRRAWSYSTRFEWRDIEVKPSEVITSVKAKGSAAVLAEMDRVKDAPLRQATFDGRELPLWGLHLIENTAEGEAGVGAAVLALRVHHTLGDGMSMVGVSRSVLETAGGGELGAGLNGSSAAEAVVKPANRGLSNFSAGKILKGIRDVIVLSSAGPDTPLPFGHFEAPLKGGAAAAHPTREGFFRSLFGPKRGSFSGRRRTVLLPDIPLTLVKKMKDVSGTTVNDVVMTIIGGCIRRYSLANGDAAGNSIGGPGFRSRALIPVALPRSSSPSGAILCNKWAFVSMNLSMDEADAATRLQELKATTTAIKTSPTPGLQYLMQSHIMPHLPLWLCREMVHGALATHTVTVSNVPGPQEPVRLAGVGMKRIHFAFSNIMPQVGVVSLDGKISINFVVDPISVPDSFSLSAHFLDELEALAAGLGVEISGDMSALRTQADELTRVMEAALTAPMSY
ncbi:unnamed protein product [Ectocarpus sp. 12 AP-2014]